MDEHLATRSYRELKSRSPLLSACWFPRDHNGEEAIGSTAAWLQVPVWFCPQYFQAVSRLLLIWCNCQSFWIISQETLTISGPISVSISLANHSFIYLRSIAFCCCQLLFPASYFSPFPNAFLSLNSGPQSTLLRDSLSGSTSAKIHISVSCISMIKVSSQQDEQHMNLVSK